MSDQVCTTCQSAKAGLVCGLCAASTCKACAGFLENGEFSFLATKPEELSHVVYCGSCFARTVAPALAEYEADLERARQMIVFFKNQGKETRLVRRQEKPLRVSACSDREETVLRLAFLAAKMGYNAVIDIDLQSKKVRDHAYQKMEWSASGVPANVSEDRIPKDRSIWSNPN